MVLKLYPLRFNIHYADELEIEVEKNWKRLLKQNEEANRQRHEQLLRSRL